MLADTAAPDANKKPADRYGLALTATTEAADAYAVALDRLLQVQSGAAEALTASVTADPSFALGHAVLALVGHEYCANTDVQAHLQQAASSAARATDRERSAVHAITAHIRQPGPVGAAAVRSHLAAYPRDALLLNVAVPTIAFAGVTELPEQAWTLVEGLAPAYGDDWWFAGLLAFVRQEQERYDEAVTLADQALAAAPEYGHAVHAKAHVFYETGQHDAGLDWLDPWIDQRSGHASHRAHFSWHAALHELALGDSTAVHARYLAQLAPPLVCGMRALVDSGSLLWRCSMRGSWPGELPIRDVLDEAGEDLLRHPPTPFAALHAAIALTAADDAAGLASLASTAASDLRPTFAGVVAPLAAGLQAVVEQRWNDAVSLLTPLERSLVRLGGSAAQREVVEDTVLFALVQTGRLDEARAVLERRLDRRPSPADTGQLASLAP